MIPISLKIKNFFSHRNTDIDFSKFNSALLVGNVEGNYDISNGSGKSAIFEAILWCLFNKSRTATIDDVIMWHESNASVKFVFSHQGDMYRVIRTRSRTTGTSTVEFNINVGGAWVDKSGSTSKLTNNEIISVIKVDYKTFVNSAYFRQNDISEFAESDAGRKKEILKSIIDLSKWDSYEKEAKKGLKTLKNECAILADKSRRIESVAKDLAESKIKLRELNALVKNKGKARDDWGLKVETLSEKYTTLKQSLDTDQWDTITEENSKLEQEIRLLTKKISSISAEVRNYERQTSQLASKISTYEKDMASITPDPDAEEKILEQQEERQKYSAEVKSSQERLFELDAIQLVDGTCYICGQGVHDDLSKELHEKHDSKVNEFKRRVVFGSNRINQITDETRALIKIKKDTARFESMKNGIASLGAKREMMAAHLDRIKSEEISLKERLALAETKLANNEHVLVSLKDDNFNNLRLEIKSAKRNKIAVQRELESINRDVGIYSQKVINLTEKTANMTISRTELLEKRGKLMAFERLSKFLGKNGIQTILLNAVIEDLEATSNNILTSICNEPFVIMLETQRVGADGFTIVDTLDLKVKKDGITQNFKSLSGGEQFRISLALRIALSEISSKHGGSSLEFLLLDEINSPLDRHGTETLFINVIKALEAKYKILVITHDDLLKERFDNVLDVTKINGESTVRFIVK